MNPKCLEFDTPVSLQVISQPTFHCLLVINIAHDTCNSQHISCHNPPMSQVQSGRSFALLIIYWNNKCNFVFNCRMKDLYYYLCSIQLWKKNEIVRVIVNCGCLHEFSSGQAFSQSRKMCCETIKVFIYTKIHADIHMKIHADICTWTHTHTYREREQRERESHSLVLAPSFYFHANTLLNRGI